MRRYKTSIQRFDEALADLKQKVDAHTFEKYQTPSPLIETTCAHCRRKLQIEDKLLIHRCPVCRKESLPCGRCTLGECKSLKECHLNAEQVQEACYVRKISKKGAKAS